MCRRDNVNGENTSWKCLLQAAIAECSATPAGAEEGRRGEGSWSRGGREELVPRPHKLL